ncbi:MAG: hypothetical protein ACK5NG_10830, partial [Chthoniobacterales bacterium]
YLWAQYIADSVAAHTPSGSNKRELDILYCPAYPPYRYDPDYPNFNWTWRTYGACMVNTPYAKDEPFGKARLYKIRLSSVPNLSKHPLLMDSIHAASHIQRMNIRSHTASVGEGSVHLRHNNKAHTAFLDGHISALDIEALKDIGFKSACDQNGNITSF